jgi:hypothetical protein
MRGSAAVSEFEERMRTYEEEAAAAFRGAHFRPYALDGRWSGLRSFGGHVASDGRTTSLTLAFTEGQPWDSTLPEVRVETRVGYIEGLDRRVATKADEFMFAEQQVHHLWFQTGVLRDDVRRYASPQHSARTDDPTTAWERALLTVDGEAVEFAVLSAGSHWVAQAIIDEALVGIQSHHWTIESAGLVTERDFEPYEHGARAIRQLWTQRPPPLPH